MKIIFGIASLVIGVITLVTLIAVLITIATTPGVHMNDAVIVPLFAVGICLTALAGYLLVSGSSER